VRLIRLITVLLLLSPVLLQAQEYPLVEIKETGLGVGFALVRFDTSVKFQDKQSDRSIFVDAEGTLDLPDWDAIPVLYGAYRFSKKHGIGFSYFQVKRESPFLYIDETLDDVQVTGQVKFSDDTRFYNLFYGYTMYEDNRSRVQGKIGLNVLDLRYVLEGEGTITYEDSTTSPSLYEDAGVTAPLPLLGFDFWYAFTPRWGINTNVSFVGGSYQDIRGWIVNSSINARYQFSKHTGAVFGIAYFDADITIEDDQERTEVKYGYDGAFLGLHIVF
jgi:carbon monoxide dehydrogenase subunit G